MSALLKNRLTPSVRIVPKHSVQSARLKRLMEEARVIREREERGEISANQAALMTDQLKDRHRTIFQRMLGV
jgi:hypothetical protein